MAEFTVPAGMTTGQYLATPAGQAQSAALNRMFAQGAWGGPGASRPARGQTSAGGRAQPKQSPYANSTPYNPQQGQNFENLSFQPGTPQHVQDDAHRRWNAWQAQYLPQGNRQARPFSAQGLPYNPQQGQPFGGVGSQQGGPFSAWANNANAPRPPAFQSQANNFDGTQSQMPNFQQRDAFIGQINNQLGQMQGQSWNQPMGAPQFNFPQMWGQANQMVQQGWQNPFGQQQGPQPHPMGHRNPFGQAGQPAGMRNRGGLQPDGSFVIID